MFIIPLSQLPLIDGAKETQGVNALNESNVPFAQMLEDSIANLQETQAIADKDALDLALGADDAVDLHTMMIHSAALESAVKTTVQLTSRAVSAYKEIMQMQI